MASVSYGLSRGEDTNPDNILVGTLAVTTDDVELRIDDTKGLTTQDIVDILEAFRRKICDGRTVRSNV